jgi:polysaccharide chain length determinant protein (PEP-CTERM system associated)
MEKETGLSLLHWHDYWAIAVRRRWCLVGPFFALGLLGCVLARVWPVRYRSEALILVEQQKVPEQYVTPNVVVNIGDRIQSMAEQILSRTRLNALIGQFNLYPKQRAYMTTSEVVDMMRADITMEPEKTTTPTGELTAFRITYTAPERKVAQEVVGALTTFIDTNLRARDTQSFDTTKFLENQLADARKQLDETEQHLRDYKMQYLGELPEQEQSNLQILSGLEAQLNAASAELDRLQQDKTYLESMQAGYRSLSLASGISPQPGIAKPGALPELRAKLADLQAKYTDRYPEVIRTKAEIARLEALQLQQKSSEELALAKKGETEASAGDNSQPGLMEMDSRLKAVRVDIENRAKEISTMRQNIRTLQAHLNLTPVREQQLQEVTRDYDNAKAQYQSLLQKESQSELATNLEKRQLGEQFRVIDPASLPEKPVEPNSLEFILAGWLLGVMAGIALTTVKQVTDTRLYNEAEVRKVSPLSILVSLPNLPSPGKESSVRRHHLIEALTALCLAVTSLGFAAYFHYWVK